MAALGVGGRGLGQRPAEGGVRGCQGRLAGTTGGRWAPLLAAGTPVWLRPDNG